MEKIERPDLAKSTLVVARKPGWYIDNDLLADSVVVPYSVDNLVRQIAGGLRWEQSQVAREIVKLGATDEKVLAALASELTAAKDSALTESADVDAVAWMCRALAVSTNEDYLPTLQSLRDDAANKKVRRYAKKFIRRYYGR